MVSVVMEDVEDVSFVLVGNELVEVIIVCLELLVILCTRSSMWVILFMVVLFIKVLLIVS